MNMCPFSACPQQWSGSSGLQTQTAARGLHHSHFVPMVETLTAVSLSVSWGGSPHSGNMGPQGQGLRMKEGRGHPNYKRQARHTPEEARRGLSLDRVYVVGSGGQRLNPRMSDLARRDSSSEQSVPISSGQDCLPPLKGGCKLLSALFRKQACS